VATKQKGQQDGQPDTRRGAPAPISNEDFMAGAKPLVVTINGIPFAAMVKAFSTGSVGWYLNTKTVVEVEGIPCSVQIGLNLTVVGSKKPRS
jgi:hypothetical protein